MSTEKTISELHTNQSFTTNRREMVKNKEFAIYPVVLMVEGVHHAVNGKPVFYSKQLLQSSVLHWEGRPIPVQHPNVDGSYVRANSPHVEADWVIGRIYNAKVQGNKLKGEAWLEVSKADEVAPGLLLSLDGGAKMEVSTGVMVTGDGIEGVWNNEAFEESILEMIPDHLALLPGDEGACSWKDGCGVRANSTKKELPEKFFNNKDQSNIITSIGEAMDKWVSKTNAQCRVPAGNPDGGQFDSCDGGRPLSKLEQKRKERKENYKSGYEDGNKNKPKSSTLSRKGAYKRGYEDGHDDWENMVEGKWEDAYELWHATGYMLNTGIEPMHKWDIAITALTTASEPEQALSVLEDMSLEFLGLKKHPMSFNEMEQSVRAAVYALRPPASPSMAPNSIASYYVREVYEDSVVYEEDSSTGIKLFKRGYSRNEDGTISLLDNVVEVKEERKFVPVNNKGDKEMADKTPCCPEKVSALIANEHTAWIDSDRDALNALSAEQIDKMHASMETMAANEKAAKDEASELRAKCAALSNNQQKPAANAAEYIAGAPPEIAAVLNAGMAELEQKRTAMISSITANTRNTFSKEQLAGMDLPQLQGIASLATTVDFSVNAGSAGGSNSAQEEEPYVADNQMFPAAK